MSPVADIALLLVPAATMLLVLCGVPAILTLRHAWTRTTTLLAVVAGALFAASVIVSARRADARPGGFSDEPLGEAPDLLLASAAVAILTVCLSARR